MQITTQDVLKKALLDTQERVRDFADYAKRVEDKQLQAYFKAYAESEGYHASELQQFLKEL